MRITLLIPLFGSHVAVTVLVGGFLQDSLGDAPSIEMSWVWIAIAFSVSYLILDDLSRFLLHYCMHNVDFLWYFHKTHHSATTLTPLTIFRVHPVESLLYFTRRLLVFGFVTGVFIWLFSSKLTGLQILGVDMFGFLFNLAAANLRHSHIWISFGKLEKIFISPAQHQIHHSVGSNHFNMGSIFSFWDRIAGTLLLSGKKRELTFGLQKSDERVVKRDADMQLIEPREMIN
jgi:sterol desaturase/sphingolipid hydroxylase (fatty acid hydroxylase superfamily)